VTETAYPSHRPFWIGPLAAALLVAALPASAELLFRAEYEMTVAGIPVGRVTRSLGREGGIYHFRSDARPIGLMGAFVKKSFHESDRWRLENGRVRPLGYRYVEREKGRESVKTDLLFDWPQRAAWERRRPICWPLTDDSQDPASASFAMMAAAARQQPALVIHSIGGRTPVDQHYRATGRGGFGEGKERIEVVKFVQTDDERLTLHAWLAPSKAWLPVYIRQVVQDGADTTLSLVRVDTLNTAELLRIWAE